METIGLILATAPAPRRCYTAAETGRDDRQDRVERGAISLAGTLVDR